uniref:Uncharacterized protein n=1 Tax=Tetraselmis sp. GSL018 TaxID=582737 RepID=A0A061R8E7_9CHLO
MLLPCHQYFMDHYFNGSFGTADLSAHEFSIENEMFDAMASIGLIRHCTVNGCKGRPLPMEAQQRIVERDASGLGLHHRHE